MFVSFNTINAILKTLPIGFYCGKQVPVSLDDTEPTSFYSPMENKIVISYPIIAQGLKKVTEDNYTETAVRSMLYHEISHVIMTPDNLFDYADEKWCTILNIFEDERIETLLNDYYLDTNFKQQLYNICGLDTTVTDPIQRFFNIVRFRYGEEKYINEVKRIIDTYKNITAIEYSYVTNYIVDIRELFNKIAGDPTAGTGNNGEENKNSNNSAGFDSIVKGEQGETQESEAQEGEEIESLNREAIREIAKQVLSADNRLDKSAKQQLASAETVIERLISNFNKKNKDGSGFNAYSGIFNPRSVGRDDYKYFERIATTNGNTKYGTCRLNLFLDRSGSFWHNENIVNALLAFLSEVERKNHNFSLSVSFINYEFKTCDNVKDRIMKCTGGNRLPENLTEIFNGIQKKNSYNYNIFLFDGDALSDECITFATKTKLFKQIDQSHTCLITDSENERYMSGNNKFTKAKVIVTNQYTKQLIENITKAFSIMFS